MKVLSSWRIILLVVFVVFAGWTAMVKHSWGMEAAVAGLILIPLAFIQNTSFSVVSRSRNRDNIRYHIVAASFSNLLWILCLKQLMSVSIAWWIAPYYILGTVSGSVCGVKVSMFIERLLGAQSDSHIRKVVLREEFDALKRKVDCAFPGLKNEGECGPGCVACKDVVK